MDTLGQIIIERLSSFGDKNVLPLYTCRCASESVLYTDVSFIQSVLYQRFHCSSIPSWPFKNFHESKPLSSQKLDNQTCLPELSVLVFLSQSKHLCCSTHLGGGEGRGEEGWGGRGGEGRGEVRGRGGSVRGGEGRVGGEGRGRERRGKREGGSVRGERRGKWQ